MRDSCFKYDSVLTKFHNKYILLEDVKVLWLNGLCCSDLSGEFDTIYKSTNKVLWHFWGEKINMNDFNEIKIIDSISYFENYGCSFLKKGNQFTWINLKPYPNFWSRLNNKSFESKVELVQNYLFVKRYSNSEKFIEIINIDNGNRTTFSTKDFKDFNLKSTNELEIIKHHGVSETLVISELLKGF